MHTYQDIISVENLLIAWEEFVQGKKNKKDVIEFSISLLDNIYTLHNDLINKIYIHGAYKFFRIYDPKMRDIHKATVRDRLLHHAIYRVLSPYFEKRFIYDSYSCRDEKGTHKAMNRFLYFYRKTSSNSRRICWILKCDIKKFFASIDHKDLISILAKHDVDTNTLWLLEEIIKSFDSGTPGTGLPLGNLTSQLLVNVYMNEFDQFVKHKLKVRYYIRFADDFVILRQNKTSLEEILKYSRIFLEKELKLKLHPNKVFIKTFFSGIDFLGWIHFPNHRVLRTTTKKRMFKKLENNQTPEKLTSYKGLLKHGNTYKLRQKLDKYDSMPDIQHSELY